MTAGIATNRKEKIKTIAHALAGFVIFLKGYNKWDNGHPFMGAFFVILGLLMVVAALRHHQISRWIKSFDVFMFATEAVVLGLVAYSYYQESKGGLPWAYGLSSGIYLILTVVFYRRGLIVKTNQ